MSMNCEKCDSKTNCIDSRQGNQGTVRRYKCRSCGHKFSTCELVCTEGVWSSHPFYLKGYIKRGHLSDIASASRIVTDMIEQIESLMDDA